ncbi:hypothetical protein CFOL_v3_31185, partial [Cephalotus follicularis]
TEDVLLITVNSTHDPSYTHILKQIFRDELIQLMSESWITNYENLYKVTKLREAVEPIYRKSNDGKVEIISLKESEEGETIAHIFTTTYPLESVLVAAFDSWGRPVYDFIDLDGHKY